MRKDSEEILGPEAPYLKTIDVLLYLAQYTRLDIIFYAHVLSRYSFVSAR